jgi:hypothetical protein
MSMVDEVRESDHLIAQSARYMGPRYISIRDAEGGFIIERASNGLGTSVAAVVTSMDDLLNFVKSYYDKEG